MKLIIDIDDEMVCNDIKNKALEPTSETDKVIINALYNGTPVSNEGDLISRSELKKAIIKRLGIKSEEFLLASERTIYDEIDNAPTVKPDISEIEEKFWHRCGFLQGYTTRLNDVRPQGKWVPVSERLPEIATTCLVQLSNGYITMGKYHSIRGGSWVFIDTTIQFVYPKDSVIAWQPLPEPYKKGG